MVSDPHTTIQTVKRDDQSVEPASQLVAQNPTLPLSPKDTFDIVSKVVAAALILVYVFGFLITSVHSSAYGFTTLNPLRPKTVAAGTWFFLFMLIPTILAASVKKEFSEVWSKKDWLRLGRWSAFCYSSCAVFGLLSSSFFNYTPISLHSRATLIVAVTLTVVLLAAWTFIRLKARRLQVVGIIALTGLNLYSIVASIYSLMQGGFDISHTTTWFFVVAILMLVEMRVSRDMGDWAIRLFIILLALGSFAKYYYPRIKSSWGGGSPIPVVLYLSKDAPAVSGKQVQAVMLDESDTGYYVVPVHEEKAIFIPRNVVSLVFFADKPSDSHLLSTGAP